MGWVVCAVGMIGTVGVVRAEGVRMWLAVGVVRADGGGYGVGVGEVVGAEGAICDTAVVEGSMIW